MTKAQIDLSSIVVHEQNQLSAMLHEELVLLNLNDSRYYGLDEVGALIWSKIAEPCSVGSVVESILEMYEVDRESCEADVLSLLRELGEAGLVRVVA